MFLSQNLVTHKARVPVWVPSFPTQSFQEEKAAQDHRSCAGPPGIGFLRAQQGRRTSWKAGTKENLQACLKGSTSEPAIPREGDKNAISLAISPFILWASVLLILEQIQMVCSGAEQTLLNQSLRRSVLATTTELPVPVAKIGEGPQHRFCDNCRRANTSEKLGS